MKIDYLLVTGARGFLGKHCAQKLKKEGCKTVVGLGNGKWHPKNYTFWGMDQWISDSVTMEALENLGNAPDCIVHCAGGSSVKTSNDNPYEDFKRTVQSTLNILEYCRRRSPKTLIIYPSSAAVYGKIIEQPIKETEALNPVSTYGLHKKIAEELIINYTHQYHLKTGIIRFFSLYGPELKKQLLWDTCQKSKSKDISFFGTGEETRDFLHIDDAVELISKISTNIDDQAGLIVNGGSGIGVSIRFIIQTIFDCLNLKSQPKFTWDKREGDPDHYIADISMARNLGWKPKMPLEQGLKQYVQWYQSLTR